MNLLWYKNWELEAGPFLPPQRAPLVLIILLHGDLELSCPVTFYRSSTGLIVFM